MKSRDHTVFLLGAGFTRAISPRMPLLQDLAAEVPKTLRGRDALPPEVRAMMREDFAHALSYLEQGKPWVTEADNLRHRALFLDLSDAIARVLDAEVDRSNRALVEKPPRWLLDLIRVWHAQQCTVISVNYDTLVETAAANVELEGGERISVRQLYPPLLTDVGLRLNLPADPSHGRSFRLLKLHGSTNWYYSGRASAYGEPIYFVPPLVSGGRDRREEREHAQRLRAVADKYPFLVPPIYDKSPLLTHETIRALWFEAGEALRSARRVVCMGYSLPDSDLTMMHFLRTTCHHDAEFEVVNPSAAALRNFQSLFRGTKVRVTQCARGRDCVSRYVARVAASN